MPKDEQTYSQRVVAKYRSLFLKNELENRLLYTDSDVPDEVIATTESIVTSPYYLSLQKIIESPAKSYAFRYVLDNTNLSIDPDLPHGTVNPHFQILPGFFNLSEIRSQLKRNALYIYSDHVHTLESFIRAALREQNPKTKVTQEDVYEFFLKATFDEAEALLGRAHFLSCLPSATTRIDFPNFVIAKSKEINVLFDQKVYKELELKDGSYFVNIGLEGKKQWEAGNTVTVSTQLKMNEVYEYFEKKGIVIKGDLDEKDWALWLICNNFFENNLHYFDISTIRRILGYTGKTNEKVEQDITDRLAKMARIQVYRQLTYTWRDKTGQLLVQEAHFDNDSNFPFYNLSDTERKLILDNGEYEWFYLLPITGGKGIKINGQHIDTGYRMDRVSDLFRISLEHNQQFSLPTRTLKTLKSNRGSTMRSRIYKYLTSQIGMPKRNCKYLFSSLCQECGLEAPYQKTRGFKIACEILDEFQQSGFIHSYEKDTSPRCRDLFVFKTAASRRAFMSSKPKRICKK